MTAFTRACAFLVVPVLTACGMSKDEKEDVAKVTCSIIVETKDMDSAFRVEKMNAAREKIGGKPYLDGDEKIKEAIQWGTCELLTLESANYDSVTSRNQELFYSAQQAAQEAAARNMELELKKQAEKAAIEAELRRTIEEEKAEINRRRQVEIAKSLVEQFTPDYPRRAKSRGITGYCVVGYSISKSGKVVDPRSVDCQPQGIFERASLNAVLKFVYKPVVVDGEAALVEDAQHKFTYGLN